MTMMKIFGTRAAVAAAGAMALLALPAVGDAQTRGSNQPVAYGADGVEWSEQAEARVAQYEAAGFGRLPVCIAKTQYSLSCDPARKGVPTGHVLTVRDVRASVGAGFLYLICGDIMTVPGLSTRPGFYDVDYDCANDRVIGLF